MVTKADYFDLAFDHVIEIARLDCVFAATRERRTGKTRLFLIYNHTGKVYFRDSLRDRWVELEEREYNIFRSLADHALMDRRIPRLRTDDIPDLN